MPLSAGTRLGPYEILAPIGKGGMGEVYRARDTKLKREVAIKILPEEFARDPDRMARFHREAELLAALNHPNIATIYGVEDRALVMELVEGNSPKGPLPFDDAWKIASQIAAALEYAHERGIIHRDLKPANILITSEGVVKLLDFGLAKAFSNHSEPSANPEHSPTLTLGVTNVGVILGTAAYMAPEQARGKAVDRRADIWSFGVVLYELLTGERLFTGEDAAEVLASVIHQQPDLAKVPRQAQRLLEECLKKDPRQRLRDIGDAKRLVGENAAPAPPVSRSGRLPWIAVGVLAAATAVALWAPWRVEKPVDRPLVRLDVDLGADVSLPDPSSGLVPFAVSPDGSRLVFASGTPKRLFVRRLDQPATTELAGTQGAVAPFFSPDGQWIGFEAVGKLNKISVEGGAVVPLSDMTGIFGASWGEDSIIVGTGGPYRGLLRFPAGGGPSETIARLAEGDLALGFPQILPGGKAVLFTAAPRPSVDVDKSTQEVLTLADRRRKIVARGGGTPRYLATSGGGVGHLIYVNRATLFAVPFDLNKLETRGTAVPILDDVANDRLGGAGQLDFSRTGTLVYRKASAFAETIVQRVDPAGTKEPLLAKPGAYGWLSLSPDGKRVAVVIGDGRNQDIWVYDPQRDVMTRLTFGGSNYLPTWSPDGQYVFFSQYGSDIFQARADGSSQPQALTQSKGHQLPCSFTPDGKRLAYMEFGTAGNSQIWTVPLEDQGGQLKAGKPEQFLKDSYDEELPAFSPDGRWLAYYSNESGRDEVYVRAFPPPSSGQGGKWQISNNGGGSPRWSRTGHELVYLSGDQIMTASYTVQGETFVAEKPNVWIAKLGRAPGTLTGWDLAPDGKRVVVVTPVESAEATKVDHELVFLQNFFDELRRRVPVGK